jgi:Zn-dependent peptidase ImmA (M78 family)
MQKEVIKMAVVRTRKFTDSDTAVSCDAEIYDTSNKILLFVNSKGIVKVPLDVKDLAEKMGIKVEYINMLNDLSGILFKDPQSNQWIIQVNNSHHINRQRYTIAHEIAHYCLHRYYKYRFEDEIYFRSGESGNIEEMDANNFASEILVPEEELRKQILRGNNKIEELAKTFGISTLALRIRAKNLGMSGHGL